MSPRPSPPQQSLLPPWLESCAVIFLPVTSFRCESGADRVDFSQKTIDIYPLTLITRAGGNAGFSDGNIRDRTKISRHRSALNGAVGRKGEVERRVGNCFYIDFPNSKLVLTSASVSPRRVVAPRCSLGLSRHLSVLPLEAIITSALTRLEVLARQTTIHSAWHEEIILSCLYIWSIDDSHTQQLLANTAILAPPVEQFPPEVASFSLSPLSQATATYRFDWLSLSEVPGGCVTEMAARIAFWDIVIPAVGTVRSGGVYRDVLACSDQGRLCSGNGLGDSRVIPRLTLKGSEKKGKKKQIDGRLEHCVLATHQPNNPSAESRPTDVDTHETLRDFPRLLSRTGEGRGCLAGSINMSTGSYYSYIPNSAPAGCGSSSG
ncbi:hypothetical protein RRG08_014675 [Elysia crispata]|uniref:Uncharacterized protein n=1 Tax=Elysia crispata TaxID=231223 RepID=A0AAE0YHM2_9GAST|nr:hypothetical protein RRG08_014675 [Elysia crispata]